MTFDIPAQPLANALNDFGRQSGLQVSVDAATTTGVSSQAVIGSFTPDEALRRMLAGSGIVWRFTDERTVVLSKVAGDADALTLDPVTVEGAMESAWGPVQGYVATRSATATKTDTPIMETPQSISVVTRDQMTAQNVQTVAEALRYTSGVQVGAFGFDPRFDQIIIRGFSVTSEADYLNGLRQPNSGWLAYFRTDPYSLERVEVLKGPSSVLYGQSGPGGLVNRVSKLPLAVPLHEVEIQGGNNDRYQGQFDLSGPPDEEGQVLYRVTGLVRDSGTQIAGIDDNRQFIQPSLTWNPNDDTTLTLLGLYQHDRTGGSATLWMDPDGKLTDLWIGDADFDKLEQTQYFGGYMLEHSFDEAWSVRQNLRYGHINVINQYLLSGTLEADGVTLNRTSYGIYETLDSFNVDTQLKGRISTGPLDHTLLFGVDYQWVNSVTQYRMGSAPPINIGAPDHNQDIPDPLLELSDNVMFANQVGLYAQDQIAFGGWRLMAGLRQDWVSQNLHYQLTDTNDHQTDRKLTGRVGLLYMTEFGLAPYASYSTSFLPTYGTDAQGQTFEPTTGRQYELGLKFQPANYDSMITLSAFDVVQQNVLVPDPVNIGFQIQEGEIRSRGVELEAVASILEGFDIVASYTFQDVEVTETTTAEAKGKRPIGIPRQMASIWGDYTLSEGTFAGLGAGAGVRYVGKTYADQANTIENDPYALVDMEVHYDWHGVRLAVNVSNLFNEEYLICQGYCYRGLGRTVIGSVRYRW